MASYRSAVTAADVVAVPGTVTCTKVAGGSCNAGEHTVFVVAGNSYGRTTAKQGNTTVTTETTNLTVRAAFAKVTGADYYDLFCSTDGAAAKWVGRVTEAQRLSGIVIDAVGSTAPGGTANAVDIAEVGTGLAVNAGHLAENTAYIVPDAVGDARYQYVDFDLSLSRTGDAVAPALRVMPFYYNDRTGIYYGGSPGTTFVFGGADTVLEPLAQRLRVETRGQPVALAVIDIAGTGASLDIDYALR